VKKPKHDFEASCPFCNAKHYHVMYRGPKSEEEKRMEALEEQRVIELRLKMQKEQEEEDTKRKSEKGNTTSSNFVLEEEFRREQELLEKQRREDEERHRRAEDQRRLQNQRLMEQEDLRRQAMLDRSYIENLMRQRLMEQQQQEDELFQQGIQRSLTETRVERSPVAISNIHEYVPQELASNSEQADIDDVMLKRAIELSIEAEKREQEEILRQVQKTNRTESVYPVVDVPFSNSELFLDDIVLVPNAEEKMSDLDFFLSDIPPSNSDNILSSDIIVKGLETNAPSTTNFLFDDSDLDIVLTDNNQQQQHRTNQTSNSILNQQQQQHEQQKKFVPVEGTDKKIQHSEIVNNNTEDADFDEELRLAIQLSLADCSTSDIQFSV
jgi:ribosomal protein L18E